MDKSFDILNDKALCVWNDTEPCVVKYNGETIKHLSAIKKNVEGTTSVTYESDYKKNLLELIVEGNTEQQGTPTPTTPQEIVNASDLSVELSGANLFDIDKVLSGISSFSKQSDGSWFTYNIALIFGKIIFTNTEQRQGKLTLLVNQKTDRDKDNSAIGYVIAYLDGSTEVLRPKVTTNYEYYSITSNSQKIVDHIRFTYNNNSYLYIKELMINWGESLPYQPYFNSTVQIPSDVTLADGTVVPLLMGEGDTLTVDKIAKKVVYIEKGYQADISQYTYDDRTSSSFTDGRRWFQLANQTEILPQIVNGKGYCNIVAPTTTDYGNYNHFRATSGTVAIITTGFESKADFNEWKKTNPIIIRLERVEPVEYDLTNTDLGRDLLALASATQNATNIITVNSSIPTSKLSVDYAEWGGKDDKN